MKRSLSKGRLRTAYLLTGLVVLFMLVDTIAKILKPAAVVDTTLALGYTEHHLVPLGIIGLVCTILYAIPRTSVLGAVLLTGYLGGAVAIHVRVDNPLFSHTLFPVYVGILAWGGVWLRDEALGRILPVRSDSSEW